MTTSSAPGLLLSLRSLHGPTLATRDRLLQIVARYREPESLAVTLAKAVTAPVDGVLTTVTPLLRAALAELDSPVPLFVWVPALSASERQEVGPGVEPAIVASRLRARRRKGWTAFWHPAWLGRDDYARRMPVLVDTELAGLPRRSVKGVVLDAWFTDLALAAGNRKFFETYLRYARRRTRGAAALDTRNLGVLLARLREWQIRPDFVVGPVNPSGLLMKPSPEEVLAEVQRSDVPVVARELCAGGVDALDVAVEYARGRGVHGLAPDLAEMDDVRAELRAIRQPG